MVTMNGKLVSVQNVSLNVRSNAFANQQASSQAGRTAFLSQLRDKVIQKSDIAQVEQTFKTQEL